MPPTSNNQVPPPDEQVLAVIHRHPIGLVFIYLETLAALVAIIVLSLVLAPDLFRDLSGEANVALTAGAILALALVALVLILATSVYRQNELVVTNKSILQTLQKGPFTQKISKLSMADVEDVTSDQKGLLQTLFNYGTLHIETSGELKNFVFPYSPSPSLYASKIGEARQRYAEDVGGD